MRFKFAVPVLLAACLVSAVAIAANDKVEASFQSFSASGVGGKAVLDAVPAGGTLVHVSLEGLTPGMQYVSRVYSLDQSCGTGTPSEQIQLFEANPAGRAQWNTRIGTDIVDIRSISIEAASDNQLQACASVTP